MLLTSIPLEELSLADGFGDWRRGDRIAWADAGVELPGDKPGTGELGRGVVDPEGFLRHYELGRRGVNWMVGGLVAGLAGGVIAGLSCYGRSDEFCLEGMSLAAGGILAIVGGQVMLLVGGIRAANDLGVSNASGWTGVGFTVAGMPYLGIAFGAAQLSEVGHAGREMGLIAF